MASEPGSDRDPSDRPLRSAADLMMRVGRGPSVLAEAKVLDRLDGHCRRFIALSPFLVIGTASADAQADVSPRGDAPGFVRVEDERTLLVPDRPGNRRFDSFRNILENPEVGLLFMIPGVDETLRINGRAHIVAEPARLAGSAVNGKSPHFGLEVAVREAFLHCSKAFVRSRLWSPDSHAAPGSLPSLGRMLADQIDGVDADNADASVAESIRDRLY